MNHSPSFVSDLVADARDYLSRQFGNIDMSSFDDATVRGCIEKSYEGGWIAYEADFRRFNATTDTPKSETLSPIKVKSMVEHMTGRRVKMYDEILSTTFTDTLVKIVIQRATVDYRTRRDIITGTTLELHVFTRPTADAKWHHESITAETEAQTAFIKWGAVNTPERDAAIREQVETCYRPGSEKTPMQGWVARAELSWKQAHADETFQSTTK